MATKLTGLRERLARMTEGILVQALGTGLAALGALAWAQLAGYIRKPTYAGLSPTLSVLLQLAVVSVAAVTIGVVLASALRRASPTLRAQDAAEAQAAATMRAVTDAMAAAVTELRMELSIAREQVHRLTAELAEERARRR